MKNYELVARLMELPAGADVKFIGTFEDDEMCYESETSTSSIERDITDLDICSGVISLM